MALIEQGQLNLLKVEGSEAYYSLVTDNPLALYLEKYEGYRFVREVEKYGSTLFWKHPGNPIPELPSEDYIKISPSFPKIPKSTLLPVAEFYYRYALDFRKHTEVGSMILLNQDTNQLEFVVPQQQVSYGSVNWDKLLDDNKPVYLFSGVETTLAELMVNHLFVGHCHSHNTMGLSQPSSTDDRTECGTKEDPRPLSFNLLFSSYALNAATGMVTFVLTPSFGYNAQRILFTDPSLELIFEDDVFKHQIPPAKPNEIRLEFSLEELGGNYDMGIHRVVTDRPVVSSFIPAARSNTSKTKPLGKALFLDDDDDTGYFLSPDISKWLHSYLAVTGDDPAEFVFAIAEELGVIE